MKVRAIVPQKALPAAKSRLDPLLTAPVRKGLSLNLLRHVCAVLRAVPVVEGFVVMTPDRAVRSAAASWGIASIPDPAPNLNAALAQTMAAVRTHGILILAADLPFLQPADLVALLHAGSRGVVALAPSKEGTGTNALFVPPGVRFQPAYGVGSRAAHRREASARALELVEVVRPGLAFDLDTPADVASLSGWARTPA